MRLFILLISLFLGTAMAQTSLNVLTYNVYAKPDPFNKAKTAERMRGICERISTGKWDVVMVQEAWTKKYRSMLAKCGLPYVMDLRRTGSKKKESGVILGSGLLILSKYPLTEQRRIVLTRPAGLAAIVKHGEGIARKSVYLARITLPSGQGLWLANTHWVANYCTDADWSDCQSYQNVRATQLAETADVVMHSTRGEPVVFGGDLNMGPLPASRDQAWVEFDRYFPGFVQAPYQDDICTSCTDNLFKDHNNGKIDHLFVSPGLTARDGAVVLQETFISRQNGRAMNLSDHYGWETTVDIP